VNEPTHVDLFSGIGGFALAAQWAGFETVAFCEIDKYCQKILAKNFLAKSDTIGRNGWTDYERHTASERGWVAEIRSDIFDFDGTAYRGCDLITGGFPCQPFSVAGKRRGAADDRALWPEMFRVISEARPAWVLGENVPGIIPMELDNVLSDLEGIGYSCRPFVIPACAVDARHRRDRLWIVGRNISDSNGQGLQGRNCGELQECSREWIARPSNPLADTEREQSAGRDNGIEWRQRSESDIGEDCRAQRTTSDVRWLPEPDVGRVAHGIPNRVDRLKGLGNSIVPQVAYEILREIRKLI
jgi:Site-specific DNA methylase